GGRGGPPTPPPGGGGRGAPGGGPGPPPAGAPAGGGAGLGLRDAALAQRYADYIDNSTGVVGSPSDRRYLDVHEGHLVYLKPGEEAFVDERGLSRTLVGSAEEIAARIRALESAGVRNLALQVAGTDGRELIEEFASQVMPRLG
ncbi:MAG: hypothetical protein OXQ29_13995, partial [Rhodospirillaceae bacterium]|nr:hypothetical protein [Rhodospirillaceae bacterium]